jgi:endo-1,4-beta-xylanase
MTCNRAASHFPNLDEQVTELDMSVYNAGDTTSNYGNNIPPSVLAEQGWLYKQYFDAFRLLSFTGHLKAVTFWGMADDDTWLDSFPVARTDYPLPFNMGLQANPAYWGIVDPTQLPGYGLTFSVSVTKTSPTTRVFAVTATNGNAGPAYATQISGFTLTHLLGPSCAPTVTAPGAFPISLGDIPASGTASTTFTVNTAGCSPIDAFTLTIPWSSAVYHTGTFLEIVNF